MPAATRPLTINPVMIGPLSLMKDNASGRAGQCDERKRFRSQLVQLVREFSGFVRRREDGSDQPEAEEAQLSKPLEEEDHQGC